MNPIKYMELCADYPDWASDKVMGRLAGKCAFLLRYLMFRWQYRRSPGAGAFVAPLADFSIKRTVEVSESHPYHFPCCYYDRVPK